MLLGFRSTLLSSFSPAALFAAGEQGVWYDPSDMTTLFQNNTTFAPVTAVEQAVGVMLDKSKGLALGPELVTNGTFATDTAWTKGVGWTIGGGVASHTGGSTVLGQSFTVTSGVLYKITYDAVITSGTLNLRLGNSFTPPARTTSGSYTQYQFGDGSSGIAVYGAFEGSIDNISVKSIAGNHATQSTPSARPVLSARVNLLTKTEQFNDAAWTKSATTISVDSIAGPDGTTTADTIINTTAASNHGVYATIAGMASSSPNKVVFHVKKSTVRYISIGLWNAGGNCGAGFDLDTNTVTGTGATGVGYSASNAAVTVLSDGWLRISVTCIAPDTTNYPAMLQRNTAYTSGSIIEIYVGTTAQSTYVWGADLRVANDTALPVYQRVDTSTSYDTTGFPMYLRFDGNDDSMVSSTITPGIDKVQAFAGLRKQSDLLTAIVAELSTLVTNNGSFAIAAPSSDGTNKYDFNARGTNNVSVVTRSPSYNAPVTNIVTAYADISADNTVMLANGVQVASSGSDLGTGNFLAYPLYIGSRAGASARFNGRIYSLIVRFGSNLTEGLIGQTENWISGKMGGGYYPTGFDFLVDANGDQITDASGNPIITQAYY